MSRSVSMPVSRSLSQIGSGPTSSAFIFRAASCTVVLGLMHSTPLVMTCLTCMVHLLCGRDVLWRSVKGSLIAGVIESVHKDVIYANPVPAFRGEQPAHDARLAN